MHTTLTLSKQSLVILLSALCTLAVFGAPSAHATGTTATCPTSKAARIVSHTPSLASVAGEGKKVTVTVKMAAGCTNQDVSLAAYSAPSGSWDPATANQQVLVDHQDVKMNGGETKTLSVTLPSCYYQVDLSAAPAMTKITGTDNQSTRGELVDASNGGSHKCTTPPPCPKACNELPEVPNHLMILAGFFGIVLLGGVYNNRRRKHA